LVQFARAGGSVWLLTGSDINTEAWNQFAAGDGGRELPWTNLARLDPATHPRLRVTDALAAPISDLTNSDRGELGSIPFRSGYAITARPPDSVMLRWSNAQPAMVQVSVGSGSIIMLGTSPERAAGGLGLSPVFPQLAGSIMTAGAAGETVPVYAIGDLPAGMWPRGKRVVVTKPDGTSGPSSDPDGVSDPDTIFNQPGQYRIAADGVSRFAAFRSPVGESESAIADPVLVQRLFTPNPSSPRTTATHPTAVSAGESRWWRILVALGFVFLCIEALVAVANGRRLPEEHPAAIG
jgi:hypothetical protein